MLVIEDDDAVRAAVRRALLLGGYEVLVAENGEQGLLQAQSDVPDAIILDLGLPDIDGMQVTRTLRSSGDRTPPGKRQLMPTTAIGSSALTRRGVATTVPLSAPSIRDRSNVATATGVG